MKKIIVLAMMCLMLVCGAVNLEAKTRAKKGKATTTATVPKDANGYPDITGHSYRYKGSPETMTIAFKGNNRCTMTLRRGSKSDSMQCIWQMIDGQVEVFDLNEYPLMVFSITDDGKQIRSPGIDGNPLVFQLVK